MPRRPALAVGLALGAALDARIPDPRHGHPVAIFGQWAAAHERAVYAPSATTGAGFLAGTVLPVALVGRRAARRARTAPGRTAVVAAATWTVLGGAGLRRAATAVQRSLEAGDLEAARQGLRSLCARDPSALTADEIVRAVVESVAENTCDAVVAPLLWGAVAGVPGLLTYRAVNTLDAMVGYRNERYERFGKPAAKVDDVVNYVPARVAASLATVLAATVGGTPAAARRVWARDGGLHPSPNAGQCEAAFAGALGVSLGGTNTYPGYVETRPSMGDGPPPVIADIERAVRLSRSVGTAATVLAALLALRSRRR
ncbi:MAG: adenosylcobinamide-phosphate synthase [Frankiaceae bacterium]|jgi:adenosylcobinamide-phosphate synthase|nr:adenosylcobinamide-phosphate synthase [Frankiaceae bacterium]